MRVPTRQDPIRIATVILTTTAALVIGPASPASGAGHPGPGDWGDAPEGALAYPSLGVVGLYPTCFGGPAGWIWHGNPGRLDDMYWGFDVDDEIDGNAGFCPPPPYERDECWGPFDNDGGLAIPDTYTINAGLVVPCGATPPTALGTPCQVLTLFPGGPLEANLVNNTALPGFVNVLIDWDQSGTWGGQLLCPGGPTDEHVIANLPVPPFYVGPLSGLSPGPVQIGPNAGFVWMRMTISNQPVPLGWGGDGLFDLGETEDYLIRIDSPTQLGEYGDAPEGALAYPGVMGEFPTCITVGPASFVYHAAVNESFFGAGLDWEADGNANVCPPPTYDEDECDGSAGDGGIIMPQPLTLDALGTPVACPGGAPGPALTGCFTARWGVDIDIRVTNNSPADHLVNVLADWDGDGKWTTAAQMCPGGPAREHVLVDFVVPSGFAGPLSSLSPPDFLIGTPADGLSWFRFTISDLALGLGWDGSGSFGVGETEDYLFAVGNPPVGVPDVRLGETGSGLHLDSVHPNPMNADTTVRLRTARAGHLRVHIYDSSGRQVTTLNDAHADAGFHEFQWGGLDAAGAEVTPGVYFVRATQSGERVAAKIVRVK